MKKYLRELNRRKDLLVYLVMSGLKAEHRNTFLGYFWWILDPLLGVVVYYFLVGIVLGRGGEDFAPFLVIGLVVFRWFKSTVKSSSKAIAKNSGIITQVYLPKAIFPLGSTLTQLINFSFGLIVIAIFLAFFRIVPGIEVVWLPFIMLIQLIFHIAISLVVGYICVFIKDIENIISHVMRILRYLSPVIWEGGRLRNTSYSWIVDINPFSYLLDGYRNVLMYNSLPDFSRLLLMGLVSIVVIIYMLHFYSRNEHKIIKVL
ncbi:ABC transporter permease [Dethiobacter alkaliphilus]|uniref:ABC transporter permease n=1 Tax=Dethiobacter alkaliphilus TaxID=427926 RepID=UPI0022277299|nr:ABC transporter permease [Dethiobacter alkaliphilus]MCW3488835.1 ABC transporter permease [Dethiobacter alkaliphilus]